MSSDFEKLVLGTATSGPGDVPLFLQDGGEQQNHNHGAMSQPHSAFLDSIEAAAAHPSSAARAQGGSHTGIADDASVTGASAVLPSAERLHFVSVPDRNHCVAEYNLHREKIIGKGNFGCATLYRNEADATHKAPLAPSQATKQYVVVKDINLQAMSSERESEVEALVSEVSALQEVKGHPNCLQLFDYFTSSSLTSMASSSSASSSAAVALADPAAFRKALLDKSTRMAYLVTEYCSGGDLAMKIEQQPRWQAGGVPRPSQTPLSLLDHQQNTSYFAEAFVASVTIQLLVTLHYLHEDKKMIHRDVKPQNVFFREDGVSMRLGDFGIAICEGGGASGIDYSSSQLLPQRKGPRPATAGTAGAGSPQAKEVKGTPFYMAPELFQESSRYTSAVDVWSAGVLLYECVCLEKPFRATGYAELSQRVVAGRCVPLGHRENLRVPASGRSRKGTDAAHDGDHELLYSKDLCDLVMSMLTTDPKLRPSCRRLLKKSYVKKHLWTVPQTLLQSSFYKNFFGEEAIRSAMENAVFPGVPEERGVARVPQPMASQHEASKRQEQEVEEAYADDFESDSDDDEE